MRSLRILALSGVALVLCMFLTACGGGGSKPAPPPTLTVVSTVVPQATINVPYSFFLRASGGSGQYTWSIAGGSLPPGLSLNANSATISGTPTAIGSYDFTAKVTDGNGNTATADLTIIVGGAIVITCNSCISGTLTLPYGNPGVPYSATLSAGGGVAPYSWCVMESDGSCDDGSHGALPPGLTIHTDNNNGVISGTPTTPGTPTTFTVQASDSESVVARGTVTLNLTIFGIGTQSFPDGTIDTPYTQNVTAVGGINPYTWTVTDGALPPGLALDPTTCTRAPTPACKITGIPSQTGSFTFTLQAKDGETPPAMASAALSITIDPRVTNGALTGNYAFSLIGYKGGNMFVMAGALVADGMGNVTGGTVDYNDGSGEPNDPSQCLGNLNCPIAETINPGPSSVYDLSSGTGLGTMTLVTTDNMSNQHTYQFSITIASANACVTNPSQSSCGRLILNDPNTPQTYGSGALKVQDSLFFTKSAFFPGNFAVLTSGLDPSGNRYAAVGAIGTNPTTGVDIDCNANGWGIQDGCPYDFNDNSTVSSDLVRGQFSATIDPNFGRGTYMNIKFPGETTLCTGGLGACGYAYYIVNKQEVIIIASDPVSRPANLTLWSVSRQKSNALGWNLGNLAGVNVTDLTAVDPNSGTPLADVTAGLLTSDSSGNATFAYDENHGGTLSLQQSSTGTLAIDTLGQKTGRFTMTGLTPLASAVGYLASPGGGFLTAYVLGADAEVTAGTMETQSAPPFANNSVTGAYGGGSVLPALSTITNSSTFITADGAGHITGTQDTSGPSGPAENNLTWTYHVDSTGRGTVMQNGNQFGILYVISPTKFVMLPVDGTPVLNVFSAGPGNN